MSEDEIILIPDIDQEVMCPWDDWACSDGKTIAFEGRGEKHKHYYPRFWILNQSA